MFLESGGLMNKKYNLGLEILKIFFWMVCGWLLWLFIFAVFTPSEVDEVVEPFRGASLVFGFLTGIVVTFIMKINLVNNLRQKTLEKGSNIKVLLKRSEKLLEKANKVADKYMVHEKEIQEKVAKANVNFKIRSSRQFQGMVENYPDLKANESILKLIEEIRNSEDLIANEKVIYNNYVMEYNTLIHNFPLSLIRAIIKYDDLAFYEEDDQEIISDEELGI